MLNDDRMSIDERRKYRKLVAPRYLGAGRGERSRLLTEMGAVAGLHRKSLIRLIEGIYVRTVWAATTACPSEMQPSLAGNSV